ncbi:MAG: hypothetical protein ACJ780_27335 [Solirubrobacteraceae bacterium]
MATMSLVGFVLAVVRVLAVAAPTVLTSMLVRRRLGGLRGPRAVLADAILALGLLLVCAEALGVAGRLRLAWLLALLWLIAALTYAATRGVTTAPPRVSPPIWPYVGRSVARPGRWSAAIAVAIVVTQWTLMTSNAVGGGMFSFDVLWYHMPFAAQFAQSGSITHIQFTQADPFVAYYPANSELFHALGIIAFGNDFLSLVINLGWMALALLASWTIGSRWRVEPLCLAAGALVLAVPVFGITQPGEAFNDVVGLAALLAAAALLADDTWSPLTLVAAGTGLGLAVGTKYTFIVPALVLLLAVLFAGGPGRLRRGVQLGAPLVLTGAWWYLRALIHTENPLGISSTVGSIQLPGPRSPLADAARQTVLSQVRHLSLWTSRFVPGLDHALGVFWPIILVACITGALVALVVRGDPFLRAMGAASLLSGLSYLVFPTGATAISQSAQLFTVNLRYAMPALALGLLLIPMLVRVYVPRLLRFVGPALVLITVAAQLEPNRWPTQPARHLVLLLPALALSAAVLVTSWQRLLKRGHVMAALFGAGAVVLGVGFVADRHYFRERYQVGVRGMPGLAAMYAWAQHVSHARIALYGTVEQYPLYGADDTNVLTYLGRSMPNGGYAPIDSCGAWQAALRRGRFGYLVLTPAPTASVPSAWSVADSGLRLVLHPAPDAWVFRLVAAARSRCP